MNQRAWIRIGRLSLGLCCNNKHSSISGVSGKTHTKLEADICTTTTGDYHHTPVLRDEVLAGLQPAPGKQYIDGTVGGGGHTIAILQRIAPGGQLLGIDADPAALAATRTRLPELSAEVSAQARLVQGNFANMRSLALAHGMGAVDGILLDLGVSSYQLDTPARGFSFAQDGPLDMRMDPSYEETAATLLARLKEQEIADILYRYGEERFSRRIAHRIVQQREQQPVETTHQLAKIVRRAVPGHKGKGRRHEHIHPATRTFQALRIAVNGELERLEQALPQAVQLLQTGGRLVVISFHSLEDRIVKWFFRAESGYGGSEAPDRPVQLRIITKKPVEAQEEERQTNPRSRSARLRVAERI